MLFNDVLVPPGPPPQAVLNQMWLWQVLQGLLFLTFLLCLCGDPFGALGAILMLWLARIMLRDGMYEMSRYAMAFATLCCLNFAFDMMYLVMEIGGRIQSQTAAQPVPSAHGGPAEVVYTVTTKKTPLFDAHMGIFYNLLSASMFVAPLAYGLGIYLAASAHQEMQRTLPANMFDDAADAALGGVGDGDVSAGPGQQTMSQASRSRLEPAPITHFQGRPYKLQPDEPDAAVGG